MVWNTEELTITRAEAHAYCTDKAREQGIRGGFKVFYDGRMVAGPSDLPEQVEKSLLQVSAVLDQA